MKKTEGWICPNCKRGVAPTEKYCDCAMVIAPLPGYPIHPYADQPWGGYWKWKSWDHPYWGTITVSASDVSANTKLPPKMDYTPSHSVTVNSPQQ